MTLLAASRALAIGFSAGLRSVTAPATTLASASNKWAPLVTILAVGESIADKFPQAPSRLFWPAFVFRLSTGAGCAAAIAARSTAPVVTAAALGALGSIAGSYGGYALRMYLTETVRLPGFPIAALEDGVAIACARYANRKDD